jgi:hypothetical protein
LCSTCAVAETDPLAAVQAFFAPGGIEDTASAYTGEMLHFVKERTLGQYLGKGATKEYRLLSSSETRVVYAVTVKADTKAQDWYIFVLRSGGTWRLEAVRTLAQTGLISSIASALRQKPDRTADEEWQLRNAELILGSDVDLKAFLRTNLAHFESLASMIRNGDAETSAAAARKLFLASTRIAKAGYVELILGGILDNTVGFLYVPDGSRPPVLEPDNVIYLERVADHWYVFKTT